MKKRKTSSKIVSMLLALMLVGTLFVPVTASAETTWNAPTEAMPVNDDIVKVGAHAAATSAVHYLGGNLVTERASDYKAITGETTAEGKLAKGTERLELGVYGTSINESPDPYMWNYLYNLYADVNGKTKSDDATFLANVGSPMAADTSVVEEYGTSYTLVRRPEVLYGVASGSGSDTNGYDALIAQLPENTDEDTSNDYDPVLVPVKATDLYAQIQTMYDLAEGIKASGKDGRYGDPDTIAQKYERYIKGTQLYVMSKIADGTIEKKTVAIIDPTGKDNGNYKVFNSNMTSGTAASCRGAEYCENTTDNIIDTLGLANIGSEGALEYEATPEQVASADVIITLVQAQISITEEEMIAKLQAQGIAKEDIPPICAVAPNGIFTITANSVENIFGIPVVQGFIYPEVVNPIYGAMYLYENFWHVSDKSAIDSLVQANFKEASLAESVKVDPAGYSSEAIEKMISEGFAYYAANADKYEGTKLEPTDNINIEPAPETKDIADVKVAAIASRTYTGKAIAPELKITDGDYTLVKDKDYSVKFSSNIYPGTAKVTITGNGDYTGTVTKTFTIKAPDLKAPTSVKVNLYGYNDLKATWSKVQGATGYYVYYKSASMKKYEFLGTTTKLSYSKANLSGGVKYSFRVYPYVKINGKPYKDASYKSSSYVYTLKKLNKPSIKKSSQNYVKVTWNNIYGESGYQIARSKYSNKNFSIVKSASYKYKSTIVKTTRNKAYYYKVRAYKVVDGKKIYGPWSTAVKYTLK